MSLNPLTRPSKTEVDGMVAGITYTRLPSGKTIVCEITLTTGWVAHGIASVVDLNNYDEQRGMEAAHGKAMQGVWDYVAVLKQQAMYEGRIQNDHAALATNYQTAFNGQPRLI